MNTLPTPEQLASITAQLARNSKVAPEKLTAEALKIWRASQATLASEQKRIDAEAENANQSLPLRSVKHPDTLDKFIRHMLPHLKGRKKERDRVLRDFVHGCEAGIRKHKLTGAELNKAVADSLKTPITYWFYTQLVPVFTDWYKDYRKQQAPELSEKRRAAAKASWKKRRAEKTARTGAQAPISKLPKEIGILFKEAKQAARSNPLT